MVVELQGLSCLGLCYTVVQLQWNRNKLVVLNRHNFFKIEEIANHLSLVDFCYIGKQFFDLFDDVGQADTCLSFNDS